MEWLSFDGVSWIGIAVAFVVSFVLGAFWYSPIAFFPAWQKAEGITDDDMKNASMGGSYAQTAIANLLGVILLAVLMASLGIDDWAGGLLLGALVGLIFRGGAHLIHNGFALRSSTVTVIDVAHDTAALAVSGLVLGLF